jgi:hypothetical protein
VAGDKPTTYMYGFKLCWGSLMPKMWITYRIWYCWPLGHPSRNVIGNRVGGLA